MSRRKNSIQNAAVALISEIVVALVGFLFPRAIIVNYGSDANGLVTFVGKGRVIITAKYNDWEIQCIIRVV